MDRSETALVPEWLKVTSGGGSGNRGAHHPLPAFQPDNAGVNIFSRHRPILHSQLSGRRYSDRDSPRYPASSDRAFHSSSRKATSRNEGVSERLNYDRDAFAHQRAYSSSRRKSSLSGYDELGCDRDVKLGEGEKLQALDRDTYLGGVNGCDRGRDYEQYVPPHRWPRLRPASRHGSESTLKHSRYMRSKKNLDNGVNKAGKDLEGLTVTPLADSLVSSVEKAAFERNFPSLGMEERQPTTQLIVPNISVSNSISRPIRHGQGGGPDLGRASTSSVTITTGSIQGISGSETSSSGCRWVSALAGAPVANLDISASNDLSTSAQQIAPGSSVSSMSPGFGSTSGFNMAEALAQNPTQVCRPQHALKQSRQLIPMTPLMPKTMGPSLSEKPKPKPKPKSLRSIDSTPSGAKVSQPVRSSQFPNSSCRVSARSEFAPRWQKLSSDQKAVPLLPMTGSARLEGKSRSCSKGNSSVFNEKKPLLQGQNRSDFFNDLRRQASVNLLVAGTQEKPTVSAAQKVDGMSGKIFLGDEFVTGVAENASVDSTLDKSGKLFSEIEVRSSEENSTILNGVSLGKINMSVEDTSESCYSMPRNRVFIYIASEEEEIAFLESLGWVENAGEEEALTEEEIDSFIKKHMSTITATNTFCRINSSLRNLRVKMRVENSASMSSGICLSETGNEDHP